MARRPVLGLSGLSPFGGGGANFGAFNILDSSEEARLIFTKAENAWQMGQISDAEYLAALQTYVNALPQNTTTRENAQQRLDQTIYTVNRNVISAGITNGTATWEDLLAYDEASLAGLNQESQEYRDRLERYRTSQRNWLADAAQTILDEYKAGRMTATQMRSWWIDQAGNQLLAGNPDLLEQIQSQIDDLGTVILQEQDSKIVTDYSDGNLTPEQFLAYAMSARARYVAGTPQATEWDRRITAAQRDQAETGLLYRYNLSQQYAQLTKFVQSNEQNKPTGGTSTSTSTRTILGADGKWRTVTSQTTTPTAPTAAEQERWRLLQIEIADAKRQMQEIAAKMAGLPDGGFVSTQTVMNYYVGQQSQYVRGSQEWYAVQGKLDTLNERLHAEKVLADQGIRVTYPGATSQPASGGGSTTDNITIDQFLASLARVESGGRYDARNATSGAYGKYQIMPSNWPAWAGKYLGNSTAPQTPENQEKVARAKVQELYNWLGSWEAVAHWWLTGGTTGHNDPSTWSASSTSYVNKVMGGLGAAPITTQSNLSSGGSRTSTSTRTTTTTPTGGSGATVNTASRPGISGSGVLSVVTGISTALDYEGQSVHYNYTQVGFPADMDARSFSNFYDGYERAYRSGAETFSLVGPDGRVTHFFIGSTPEDRLLRMSQLDDLRIAMLQEQVASRTGLGDEIPAAVKLSNAYKDAAAHDYMVLATSVSGQTATSIATGKDRFYADEDIIPGQNVINPLWAAESMANRLKEAFEREVAAAQAAWDRGDYRAAYAHMQIASHMYDGDSTIRAAADSYLAQAKQMIALIGQSTGIGLQDALGSEASEITALISRIGNLGIEEATLMKDTGFNDLQREMEVVIKGGRNPILTPDGDVELNSGYGVFIDTAGNLKIQPIKGGGAYDVATGTANVAPPGAVSTIVNTGTSTVEAWANYITGTVGSIILANGQRVALYGKIISVVDPSTGKMTYHYQNPWDGTWSNTFIHYKAPREFEVVSNPDGTQKFILRAPMGRKPDGSVGPMIDQRDNSNTVYYEFVYDPKTGTYTLKRVDTGPFVSAENRETMTTYSQGSDFAELLTNIGFEGQGGTGVLNHSQSPMIGFTEQTAKAYLGIGNAKPIPVLRTDQAWVTRRTGESDIGFNLPYTGSRLDYDPDAPGGNPDWVAPGWDPATGTSDPIKLPTMQDYWRSGYGTGAEDYSIVNPNAAELPDLWTSPSGTGATDYSMPTIEPPKVTQPAPVPKTVTVVKQPTATVSPTGTQLPTAEEEGQTVVKTGVGGKAIL